MAAVIPEHLARRVATRLRDHRSRNGQTDDSDAGVSDPLVKRGWGHEHCDRGGSLTPSPIGVVPALLTDGGEGRRVDTDRVEGRKVS
jgi:hypothetical protein